MIFKTEAEFLKFAENIGKNLSFPAVFELIGDVGAGKTTFTRGLAKGLGVTEPITSPSFSISKRYLIPSRTSEASSITLIHYDFYRLSDPGLMSFELAEALSEPNSVIAIEWGESVQDLLPASHTTLTISVFPDGSRQVELISPDTKKDRS